MTSKVKAIVELISELKFHEVSLLNEALKRELKIPDVQRVVAGSFAASSSQESSASSSEGPVKSNYTVKLVKFEDAKKVTLIKEIKGLVEGINLVEAKRFVESCPKIIKSNLAKDDAEELKKRLESAGGVVKLE